MAEAVLKTFGHRVALMKFKSHLKPGEESGSMEAISSYHLSNLMVTSLHMADAVLLNQDASSDSIPDPATIQYTGKW
jgi:hypothetical protein